MRLEQVLTSIGANVRALRTERKLTQGELAERADLDLRFVQRVEYGQTNLSVAVLVALAHALGVKPEDFFAPARLPAARRGRPSRT